MATRKRWPEVPFIVRRAQRSYLGEPRVDPHPFPVPPFQPTVMRAGAGNPMVILEVEHSQVVLSTLRPLEGWALSRPSVVRPPPRMPTKHGRHRGRPSTSTIAPTQKVHDTLQAALTRRPAVSSVSAKDIIPSCTLTPR